MQLSLQKLQREDPGAVIRMRRALIVTFILIVVLIALIAIAR